MVVWRKPTMYKEANEHMKELFDTAELEVFYFESTDIITVSNQGTEWEDEL